MFETIELSARNPHVACRLIDLYVNPMLDKCSFPVRNLQRPCAAEEEQTAPPTVFLPIHLAGTGYDTLSTTLPRMEWRFPVSRSVVAITPGVFLPPSGPL